MRPLGPKDCCDIARAHAHACRQLPDRAACIALLASDHCLSVHVLLLARTSCFLIHARYRCIRLIPASLVGAVRARSSSSPRSCHLRVRSRTVSKSSLCHGLLSAETGSIAKACFAPSFSRFQSKSGSCSCSASAAASRVCELLAHLSADSKSCEVSSGESHTCSTCSLLQWLFGGWPGKGHGWRNTHLSGQWSVSLMLLDSWSRSPRRSWTSTATVVVVAVQLVSK
mmetsp:Transcript_17349/g.27699  ORF Transcript_17349/g.27699 Transcript_17349/m.27699 type:complete len:227 (-) Transcript_17349:285-965(-)